jgi:hypothetical protein
MRKVIARRAKRTEAIAIGRRMGLPDAMASLRSQ